MCFLLCELFLCFHQINTRSSTELKIKNNNTKKLRNLLLVADIHHISYYCQNKQNSIWYINVNLANYCKLLIVILLSSFLILRYTYSYQFSLVELKNIIKKAYYIQIWIIIGNFQYLNKSCHITYATVFEHNDRINTKSGSVGFYMSR